MDRHLRLSELLIGVEGLTLLRGLYESSDEAAARRIGEVRAILDSEAFAAQEPIREADPRTGYQVWSEVYDEPGNPIIDLEQPAVWSLLEPLAAGRALDAACGTGRHARRLVALGHDVLCTRSGPFSAGTRRSPMRRASAGSCASTPTATAISWRRCASRGWSSVDA